MRDLTHLQYELLRTVRNWRLLALSLALPLIVFYAVTPENRHSLTDGGIPFPLFEMTAMAVYGAMWASVLPGARVAFDRSIGWTRQLRVTPLRTRTYIASKVLAAYLAGMLALALLYLAGVSLGVHLRAEQWLEMTGLILVGLAPFVVLGIVAGNLVTVDALAPAVGGGVVLFALFGGAFGELFKRGVMLSLVKLLPSYWLVQAGKTAHGSGGWPTEGWLVILVWTAALIPLAVFGYGHETGGG